MLFVDCIVFNYPLIAWFVSSTSEMEQKMSDKRPRYNTFYNLTVGVTFTVVYIPF